MRVNLDACIQCGLCVRACREVQVNDVIGMAYRSHDAKIVFDFDDPMGESTCVACGECVQACPTGALMPAALIDDANQTRAIYPDRKVDSLCPFCGVGCQVTYQVKDDTHRLRRRPRRAGQSQPALRQGPFRLRLHPSSAPPDQAAGAAAGCEAKDADDQVDPANPFTHFREASWEEALDHRGQAAWCGSATAKGAKALAGFGSAKGSNEEAYLFQKLVRTGFGSNNVDHCTRLCHASSVAALMEGLNSGAVSAPFRRRDRCRSHHRDRRQSDRQSSGRRDLHQERGQQRGAKLIVIDPRRQALSRHACKHLAFKPGSDVALLNAMLHTIITEGLTDEQYIAGYTERLRGAEGAASSNSRRRRWSRSAASARDDPRGRAGLRDARAPRSSSGAWASASTSTAPTMRAA